MLNRGVVREEALPSGSTGYRLADGRTRPSASGREGETSHWPEPLPRRTPLDTEQLRDVGRHNARANPCSRRSAVGVPYRRQIVVHQEAGAATPWRRAAARSRLGRGPRRACPCRQAGGAARHSAIRPGLTPSRPLRMSIEKCRSVITESCRSVVGLDASSAVNQPRGRLLSRRWAVAYRLRLRDLGHGHTGPVRDHAEHRRPIHAGHTRRQARQRRE
jgi:hypothetical protein